MKRNFPSGKKRLRWYVLAFLGLYFCAVVFPYALPLPMPQTVPAGENAASGQRAVLLESGEEALWGRLQLIEGAKAHIRLSSYLYACDESGSRIGAALLRAADRGVQVEILVDGLIGAINFGTHPLPRALASHENIEIRLYNPLNLLKPHQINARLHDKYLVADETAVIVGGRNISDEFLVPESHPSYNADRDVLLFCPEPGENTGAAQMARYFDALWNSAYVTPAYETPGDATAIAQERRRMEALLQETEAENSAAYAYLQSPDHSVPVDHAEVISNPIHPGKKEPVVLARLCALMQKAQSRAWLQSPYFVLNRDMEQALAAAAGPADVRLFTNSMASGNNIMASGDYLWRRGRVLSMGLPVYESQTPYSLHTKSLLVDEDLSVFGSFNFDMRSAYIDTEVMLLLESQPLNQWLANAMEHVAGNCLLATPDGYAYNAALPPKQMDAGKWMVICVLSPVLYLIRYLL